MVVHHKIDRFCCQSAYLEHLEQTRGCAYTKNKHVARGLINEKINGDGKAFMRGKSITASAIQGFYETYDAHAHIRRNLKDATSKHQSPKATNPDYLHKYANDKVALLSFFLERLGSTWEEATTPSPINRMTRKSSGNEPWKHVQAISEGRRHLGERKNRMTWLQHVRKHTAKHPRK